MAGAKNHEYHILPPSPWPLLSAFAALVMATGGIIMQHPIMASLLMIGAVIGLQFAISANRNSGLGVVLLFGMTIRDFPLTAWRKQHTK